MQQQKAEKPSQPGWTYRADTAHGSMDRRVVCGTDSGPLQITMLARRRIILRGHDWCLEYRAGSADQYAAIQELVGHINALQGSDWRGTQVDGQARTRYRIRRKAACKK